MTRDELRQQLVIHAPPMPWSFYLSEAARRPVTGLPDWPIFPRASAPPHLMERCASAYDAWLAGGLQGPLADVEFEASAEPVRLGNLPFLRKTLEECEASARAIAEKRRLLSDGNYTTTLLRVEWPWWYAERVLEAMPPEEAAPPPTTLDCLACGHVHQALSEVPAPGLCVVCPCDRVAPFTHPGWRP